MKRLAAILIIAALMVMCLAACGGSVSTQSSEAPPEASADASAEAQIGEPVDAPAETIIPTEPEAPEDYLPLSEEGAELSAWLPLNPNAATYLEDGLDSHIMYKAVEEVTNVHINWTSPNVFASTENFQLMIAGGELPDIIYEFISNYNGGAAGLDDDLIIDVRELIDEGLTPNYKAIMDSNPDYSRSVPELDGRIAGFATFYEDLPTVYGGLLVRQDWLDKLGMEAPETYDELHDVLAAMKSEFSLPDGPLWIPADGNPNYNNLVQGFGTIAKHAADGSIPVFVQDGTLKFGTYEAGYKDYIDLMAKWYDEGLLFSDFVTEIDPHGITSDMASTGKVGVFEGGKGFVVAFKNQAQDADYAISAMADIVKNKGDTTHCLKSGDLYGGIGLSISTCCENVELAARWCDFWYSQQGYYFINYGVEGETYTKSDDGSVQWTELVTNNPYGMELESATALYCTFNHPGVMNPQRTYSVFNVAQMECDTVWSQRSDNQWKYPSASVKLTTEETSIVNNHLTDVLTYSGEMTLRWITGELSTDATWDEYLSTMKDLGIDEIISIYQTAYDRYIEQ